MYSVDEIKEFFNVIWDKKYTTKLKRKFCYIATRYTVLYGT